MHLFVDSRSLQVLFEANELAGRDLERRVVDLSLFYNDSVSKRLDFKEEYQIWKRSHGGRERYGLAAALGCRLICTMLRRWARS
jgi:hypothetical protein